MKKVDHNKYSCLKPTAICLALLSIFSSQVSAEIFDDKKVTEGKEYKARPGESYDSLNIHINPKIEWDQYFLSALNDSEKGVANFTITGPTEFTSYSDEVIKTENYGTCAFFAKGESGKPLVKPEINLVGDIYAKVIHDVKDTSSENPDNPDGPDDEPHSVGAQLFYAKYGGTITLGKSGSTTLAWVLADIPDLISAKCGGTVKVESTWNQFVGSIDLAETDVNDWFQNGSSSVTATFNGKDSYWYGDEHSYMNFSINKISDENLSRLLGENGYHDGMGISQVAEIVSEIVSKHPEDILSKYPLLVLMSQFKQKDVFDLTFENGAEWSYLGQSKTGTFAKTVDGGSISKRISSITLNGGVINLADEYLARRWEEIGLSKYSQIQRVEHDYVRIGDLKGSGGIFRIDLNGEEKSQSDMIFIESTSETAAVTHKIEPYKLDTLSSIANSDEKLLFALTQTRANNIRFEDKANYYGETLFDYEVEIASEEIVKNANGEILEEFNFADDYVKYDSFNADDYVDGTAWFIQHVNLKQSTASIGMRGAGYASYDAVVQMDRHDRRIKESVFADGRDSGLWVRVQHGQMGAKGVYSSDVDTVYVGAEGKLTDTLRLGASFSYLDGDADFPGIDGSNDVERYEGSVYGTFESGAHYLDVVARFGRVNNDFYTSNAAVSKSGVFHQKYAALSAEYGYKFDTGLGFFVEPQVQGQAAYLGSYDANVGGTMNMEADSTTSFIGRVGMRMGKTIKTEAVAAEVYARVDALHQFTDGQDAVQRNNKGERLDVTWGDAGTWYNYGVGGYLNWKDRFGFQLDLEKSSGGEVDDTWLLSGRLNYYF